MGYRCWIVFLICLCSCTQDTVVIVSVKELSKDVNSLRVTATFDGSHETQDFRQNQDSFAIQLPPGTEGTLSLEVEGRIVLEDGTTPPCKVQVGKQEGIHLVPSGSIDTQLTLEPAELVMTTFSPMLGISTGGTSITITGTGFKPGRSPEVQFDGTPASNVKVDSPCQLTAVLPSDIGAVGPVPVTVQQDGRISSNGVGFAYYWQRLDFASRQIFTFPVGVKPESAVVGDVNEDGHQDLVVSNKFSDTVSVLFGRGDGTFRPQKPVATGAAPVEVVIGDLNGDKHLDIAVANQDGGGSVRVLLGQGDGTFSAREDDYPTKGANSVAIGYLDGDDILDLAVAGTSSVGVLLGKGNGTFFPSREFTTGDKGESVTIGDLNGDTKQDLAIANDKQTVSVLFGLGDGNFQPHQDQALPPDASAALVRIADVDQDGFQDVVVANDSQSSTNGTVSVLRGKKDGTFYARQDVIAGNHPTGVAIGDLNNDGRLDLAVANFYGNTVRLLLGKGDGTFQPYQDLPAGNGPFSVTIGALNGKDKSLIVVNADDDTLSVILRPIDPVDFSVGTNPSKAAVGDVDEDGVLDLAVANQGSNAVSLLLGKGDGTFQDKRPFDTGVTTDVAIGDLDGDGHADLAVSGGAAVSVLRGDGKGNFSSRQDFATGSKGISVAIGDVNGDLILDLVVANQGSKSVSVLLGKGGGMFQDRKDFDTGVTTDVAIGDLNGDGLPDLAVSGSNSVSVLLGDGKGNFSARQNFATGFTGMSVKIGDLNGDLIPDMVVANQASNSVSVLLGKRGGTFELRRDFRSGRGPSSIAIGDVDRDSYPDLVVANVYDNTVSVLLSRRDGTFSPPQDFPTGRSPSGVALGVLRQAGRLDGAALRKPDRLDIITTSQTDNAVRVLFNNSL